MHTKKKIVWSVSILAGLILLLFLANFYVKQRLQEELDSQLQAAAYEDLYVNIFLNKFSIEDLVMKRDGLAVDAEKVQVEGLSYYKFLFKDELEIDLLEFLAPQVRIFPKDTTAKQESSKQRELLINTFSVKNGTLRKQSVDTTTFYAHIPQARVQKVGPGMDYRDLGSYKLEVDSLYLKINPEHYMAIGNFSAEDGAVEVSDFRIRSFYPRREFDQIIPFEKDWVNLEIESISLDSLSFRERNDSLYFANPKMVVSRADLNIYRNKLVEDDTTFKPLYSQMLREAPVYLNFDRVLVENSEIVYEEQVKAEDGPAIVRFAALNGEIKNLHNLRSLSSQPTITANADFMQGTPVEVDWTFPVFDPQEKFQISGSFGRLEGEALDPFLVPAMNARARGTVDDIYFNFYGNNDVLRGDFRMNYDSFEIAMLNQEEEKKGFLSAIANLFVDNKQEPEEGDGQEVMVERVKNRSFWNFVWKGLMEGLRDALSQL